jgi:hypothetical protein
LTTIPLRIVLPTDAGAAKTMTARQYRRPVIHRIFFFIFMNRILFVRRSFLGVQAGKEGRASHSFQQPCARLAFHSGRLDPSCGGGRTWLKSVMEAGNTG